MLLTRALAGSARAALSELSERLLVARPPSSGGPTLAGGHAGIALAHAVLESQFPGRGHAEGAARSLSDAVKMLAATPSSSSLYGGFVGVAWVTELLSDGRRRDADPNAEIDAALREYLAHARGRAEPYDLISGFVGLGVYALERVPRGSAKELLRSIVEHLDATAERTRQGVTWKSPHPSEGNVRRMRYNLGVAHGVPGVIALLGRISNADLPSATRSRAARLLEDAVAWLVTQEHASGSEGHFDYATEPGSRGTPSRIAWCYGDLGVAAALLVAARAARERIWERHAVRIALDASRRELGTAGVVDAGLCHGAAGNAHIFHRLFLTTGEKRFAQAARDWWETALAMRRPKGGIAGFRAYVPDRSGRLRWTADPTFLNGAAGIALALAAALDREPDPVWDRVLLLS